VQLYQLSRLRGIGEWTSWCSSLPGHSLDTALPGNAERRALRECRVSWERRAPARWRGRASARPSRASPLTPHPSVTTCACHPESVEFLGTSSTGSMTRTTQCPFLPGASLDTVPLGDAVWLTP